jgi:hypothetical protein
VQDLYTGMEGVITISWHQIIMYDNKSSHEIISNIHLSRSSGPTWTYVDHLVVHRPLSAMGHVYNYLIVFTYTYLSHSTPHAHLWIIWSCIHLFWPYGPVYISLDGQILLSRSAAPYALLCIVASCTHLSAIRSRVPLSRCCHIHLSVNRIHMHLLGSSRHAHTLSAIQSRIELSRCPHMQLYRSVGPT